MAVIRYGEFTAEIGGELSGALERAVAERVGHVDVYGVHNHASPDSATKTGCRSSAQVGIVSVSPGNPDREPSMEAMARLHAAGVTTYWTSIGNGASPEPGRDNVVGNIVVEVPADASRFNVRGEATGDASPFATGRDAAARNAKTFRSGRNAATSATSAVSGVVQELTITTFAGGSGAYGYADGSRALFKLPQATAVDASGTVFVADTANHTIRKITSDGNVTTFAGAPGQAGSTDGNGTAARFDQPIGIAVDSTGTVYVADYGNSTIRRISPSGVVSTLAGSPGRTRDDDGFGGAARFSQPTTSRSMRAATSTWRTRGIAPFANLARYPRLDARGVARATRVVDGTGSAARFTTPGGIASDGGAALRVDFSDHTIRRSSAARHHVGRQSGAGGHDNGNGPSARSAAPGKPVSTARGTSTSPTR